MLDKMEEPAAIFKGTVGRISTVPSRGVVVMTVELPIEEHELVARIASHGCWVAVCRIQQPAEQIKTKEKKHWNELTPATQSGILCADLEFQEFLGVKTTEAAITDLYRRFEISSRSEISTNSRVAREWSSLVDEFRIFQKAKG